MSTHEVMFRTGSKPPDEGKGVGGGGGGGGGGVAAIIQSLR